MPFFLLVEYLYVAMPLSHLFTLPRYESSALLLSKVSCLQIKTVSSTRLQYHSVTNFSTVRCNLVRSHGVLKDRTDG